METITRLALDRTDGTIAVVGRAPLEHRQRQARAQLGELESIVQDTSVPFHPGLAGAGRP